MQTVDTTTPTEPSAALSPKLLWLMAAACGVSVANAYYNQPLLGAFGQSTSRNSTASIPATGSVWCVIWTPFAPVAARPIATMKKPAPFTRSKGKVRCPPNLFSAQPRLPG